MIKQEFTTGTLSININQSEWDALALFGFAQRRNPKRAFLFVSKILGKHIPVSPAVMRRSYQILAQKINPKHRDGVLFIGMAETAVGLACGIYQEAEKKLTQSLLMTSTRHNINAELIAEFKEMHSHATDHFLYRPVPLYDFKKVKTLVLIDDEQTTGNTFANLINALFENNLLNEQSVKEIIVVTLTDWSNDRLQQINPTTIPITQVSLLQGNWHWQPLPYANQIEIPKASSTKQTPTISARQDWGRVGMNQYQAQDWLNKFNALPNEKIWVLGTGEFLFPPFLGAERLEQQGAIVKFSSTTRSPIALGLAIKSAIAFTDNYGQGIDNFCYNLESEFDRIILCVETDPSLIDKSLLEALNQLADRVEIAYYD